MLAPAIYEFLKARGVPVPIGTPSVHGGRNVIKTAEGWKPVKGQGQAKKKAELNKQAKVKNINKRNRKTGLTPLHEAILDGRKLVTIKKLIEQGANVNARSRYGGATPLLEAVEESRTGIVKLLLEHGAKVNLPNAFGFTPLHWAVGKNNKTMARLLLQHGASPYVKNDEGLSPLKYAVSEKNAQLALLLARGVKKQKKAVA